MAKCLIGKWNDDKNRIHPVCDLPANGVNSIADTGLGHGPMTYPIVRLNRSHWTRESMPQIDDTTSFLAYLESRSIGHKTLTLDSAHIRPTQSEVNMAIVVKLMPVLDTSKYPVIVSRDNRVLDGNHRWYTAWVLRQDCHVVRVNESMTSLLALALAWPGAHRSTVQHVGTIHNR